MHSKPIAITLLLLLGAAGYSVSGCGGSDTCKDSSTCTTNGTGGSTVSTTSSGGGGAGGGESSDCVPSANADPVADTCGVFVSSSKGKDGNGAVKGAPAQTLAKAVVQAQSPGRSKRVYACAEVFTEAVTIAAGVTIYGGLDCTKDWAYVGATKKTTLTAAADAIPLTVTSAGTGTQIHDLAITAADAMKDGGSAIALVDDGAELALDHVDLKAGAAKPGAPGMEQEALMTPDTANGANGVGSMACTLAGPLSGGVAGVNTCSGIDTSGGLGGNGLAANAGGDGAAGLPLGPVSNGGTGQQKTASCKTGQQGTDGVAGTPGVGAHGPGMLSTTGLTGALGADGSAGIAGQGGGGGGGARQCNVAGTFAGPSGGGGGAGGCAGLGGKAGGAGGSSLGLIALNTKKLTLTTVTITTADGGLGGLGGDGQLGGSGGLPGAAIGGGACGGGNGGQGGAGGPGGGGTGGHAAGIAVSGGTLPDLGTTKITHGSGAIGGFGGDMDMTPQTKGDDGLSCSTLDLTDPMNPICAK